MNYKWDFIPHPSPQQVISLGNDINVSDVLATLLINRGVKNYDEAKVFFRPTLDMLHDPFVMADMDKAVNRLTEAIHAGEKILIYGDYDVDGSTAVAMVFDFLSSIHEAIDFYIPDRYLEGYGVSEKGLNYAIENGFSLMITLDCGIKANKLVDKAKSAAVDVIICDHHNPDDQLPEAVAVLDPKRKDCHYPFKELSGCGVGFKFLHAFCLQNDFPLADLYEYLDLVAISIASDIVPIVKENRVLAYYGLRKLNQNPRTGIKALLQIAGISGELDISKVVFGIGPRINAAGRIAHAKAAVELLITEDIHLALQYANTINLHNQERKNFDSSITAEALTMIQSEQDHSEKKTTVLYKEDWHKGVIGIVASRCIEKYYRPTVIMTASEEKVTGSARSVQGFDVYEAIEACADLLEQFGGHQFAAGLTIKPEHIPAFQEKFEAEVSSRIKDEHLCPAIAIDHVIELDDINDKFFNVLKQMGPYGPGNMTPVFVAKYLRVIGEPQLLKGKHIKFTVGQSNNAAELGTIGFGMEEYFEPLTAGLPFDMAFTIEENIYRNFASLQLMIKDIKFRN